tara:strand:- start:393 stop:2048 length:1656 start_codon:yes stop_codon:yes gene_type:complete
MSVFYNYTIRGNATGKNDTQASFRGDRTEEILDQSNKYEVAVCRFKIPTHTIPKYTIDDSLNPIQRIGCYCNFNNAEEVTGDINTSGGNNKVSGNNAWVESDKEIQNSTFNIETDEEYAKVMNSVLYSSFSEMAYNSAKYNSTGGTFEVSSGYTDADIGAGASVDQSSITMPTATTGKNKMICFRVNIKEWNSNDLGAKFCDLQLGLQVDATTYNLFGGCGSDITTFFSDTNEIMISPVFPQAINQGLRSSNDLKNFSPTSSNYLGFRTELEGDLGRLLYNLDVDALTIKLVATNQGNVTMKAKFDLKVFYAATDTTGTILGCPFLTDAAFAVHFHPPQFLYNSTDKVMEIHTQRILHQNFRFGSLASRNKVNFCLNNNANSLVKFNTKNIDSNMILNNDGDGSGDWGNAGRNIIFDLDDVDDLQDPTKLYSEDIIATETQNSSFLRQQLSSIVFSTSQPVRSEILQGNGQTRQILTDFNIDPDLNTDYLQYESQGYLRFYPLISNLPLRTMDLVVDYEDIYGNIKPLTIANGQELKAKLEFRPKNSDFDY